MIGPRRASKAFAAALVASLVLLASSLAQAETAGKTALQSDLDTFCATCHGTDLVAQQRLSEQQWGHVIDKMIGWGAGLPAERRAALASALATEYGSEAPPYRPARITGAAALELIAPTPAHAAESGDRKAGRQLYEQQCALCHGAEARGQIGLALVDKPILDRPSEFVSTVVNGQRGMPAMAHLEPTAIADLLAYLRHLD